MNSQKRESVSAHTAQIFTALVENWNNETGASSVTSRRYSHPSYQAILGLGKDAIPLILQELRDRPDWWFEALTELAQPNVNPVPPDATFAEAVDAWLEWGLENGIIDEEQEAR